jgi:hypothetical protein
MSELIDTCKSFLEFSNFTYVKNDKCYVFSIPTFSNIYIIDFNDNSNHILDKIRLYIMEIISFYESNDIEMFKFLIQLSYRFIKIISSFISEEDKINETLFKFQISLDFYNKKVETKVVKESIKNEIINDSLRDAVTKIVIDKIEKSKEKKELNLSLYSNYKIQFNSEHNEVKTIKGKVIIQLKDKIVLSKLTYDDRSDCIFILNKNDIVDYSIISCIMIDNSDSKYYSNTECYELTFKNEDENEFNTTTYFSKEINFDEVNFDERVFILRSFKVILNNNNEIMDKDAYHILNIKNLVDIKVSNN